VAILLADFLDSLVEALLVGGFRTELFFSVFPCACYIPLQSYFFPRVLAIYLYNHIFSPVCLLYTSTIIFFPPCACYVPLQSYFSPRVLAIYLYNHIFPPVCLLYTSTIIFSYYARKVV